MQSQSHRSVCRNITLLLAATCGLAMHAEADIFNVPADYATIQDAVDPATDGDEIVIAPGTYAPFTIGSEEILFRSTGGPEVTIIDGGGTDPCVSSLGGKGTFEGLTFTNDSGANGGAVHFLFGSATLSFDDCIFSNNSNWAVGAPNAGGELTYTGCTFIGNSGSNGGATRVLSADCEFIDCNFLNNTATTAGGAIYLSNSADVIIAGCTFEGNSAPYGGAIINYSPFSNPSDQLDDCVFDGNTATGADGGGAIWTSNSIPITNCMFLNNAAQTGPGGAVHATGTSGSATIANCTFDQNDGTDGGTATDCIFTGNIASGNGGAMFIASVDATNCTMDGNSAAGTGGAVHAESGMFTLINCNMSANDAGTSGGGVYVVDLAVVEISDSTLCLNTPDQFDFVGALLARCWRRTCSAATSSARRSIPSAPAACRRAAARC